MSKEQIINYVTNSLANTNPNVLSGMLDGIGGNTVEFIKLGTFNGGTSLSDGGVNHFTAGGTLTGGSLYDLVGDKTILGFRIVDSSHTLKGHEGSYYGYTQAYPHSDGKNYDIPTAPIEVRKEILNCGFFGIASSINVGSILIDVYAICI